MSLGGIEVDTLPTTLIPVTGVLCVRTKEQMVNVDTRWVVACVPYEHPFRDRPVLLRPYDPVDAVRDIIEFDGAIPTGELACFPFIAIHLLIIGQS